MKKMNEIVDVLTSIAETYEERWRILIKKMKNFDKKDEGGDSTFQPISEQHLYMS
jgi:hypothetical protein